MIGFARPEFLWALPLILLPVIIHLLSRLRYPRFVFPATRFLLEGQRRQKIRVLLQEWLLLALRMALIAGIVLAFARPRAESARLWGSLTGQREHFVIMLDDTLSMQSRRAALEAETCWQQAKSAVNEFIKELVSRHGSARISLFRVSQLVSEQIRVDLAGEVLNSETFSRIAGMVDAFPASFASVPVHQALARAVEVVDLARETVTVLVFSDFRAIDWQPGSQWGEISERLRQARCPVRLIPCASPYASGNVAITKLEPSGGIRAVGVPLALRLSIENFSDRSLRNVPVEVFCEGQPLPPIVIPELPAGTSAHHDFYAIPPHSGDLRIEARLPADVLEADNRRYLVVPVQEVVRVLLVAAELGSEDAQFVELALSPGGGVNTGIICRRSVGEALSQEAIESFDLICFLGGGVSDPLLAERLREFLANGGGLLYFVGPQTDLVRFEEDFCRGERGIFPVRLRGVKELAPSVFLSTGNVEFVEHPGLRGLAALKGPLVEPIFVSRYLAFDPAEELERSGLQAENRRLAGQVFLRLKEGQPLGMTFTFGRGKAALVATTAAPSWNNWARVSPSFVVTLLELAGYLARHERPVTSAVAGSLAKFEFPSGKLPAEVRYRLPGSDVDERLTSRPGTEDRLETLPVPMPGFGTLEWRTDDGQTVLRYFAANVDCRESDLRLVSSRDVAGLFAGCDVAVIEPESITQVDVAVQAVDIVPPMMSLVLLVLAAEAGAIFLTIRQRSGTRKGR
ncbi:MAG: BatA domain-containing protein [Thermoguttaceae bacterium]|nr:BatA domain-containing protein [Thermoguttaceae bacterium]MDW8077356.1 BatA domain-containing protein [Thermoguttaceae bacterium]